MAEGALKGLSGKIRKNPEVVAMTSCVFGPAVSSSFHWIKSILAGAK